MTDFVTLQIDDARMRRAFAALVASCVDLTPAMRKVSQTLARETEKNFAAQGRPKWKPLAAATLKARTKKQGASGTGGVMILQDTGLLASSVTAAYDESQAAIGSNRVYARIHQMGGKAGRGGAVTIPSRPFLPFSASGTLQPEASDQVLATVMRHLRASAGV